MHALLERCSPALIKRLGGKRGETLALERILAQARRMPYPQQQILTWQFGLDGCDVCDVTAVADRLRLPVDRAEHLLEQALVDLGFALVGGPPADMAVVPAVRSASGRLD